MERKLRIHVELRSFFLRKIRKCYNIFNSRNQIQMFFCYETEIPY